MITETWSGIIVRPQLLFCWLGEQKHLLLTSVKPETSPFANGLLMDGVYTLASDTGCPFIKCFPDS